MNQFEILFQRYGVSHTTTILISYIAISALFVSYTYIIKHFTTISNYKSYNLI